MKKIILMSLVFFSSAFADISVQKLSSSPKILVISDFLSPAECDHLIQLASLQLKRSTVVDDDGKTDIKLDSRRSSEGMFLPPDSSDKIVQAIEERIVTLTHYPKERGEPLQILRYQIGAEYQPHFDYFNPDTTGGTVHLQRGGQRIATLIMYLNTPEKGGETIFPTAKVSVTPKKGSAVFFYNCTSSGETDPRSLHGGAPVLDGEKWIATKWIRAGNFK